MRSVFIVVPAYDEAPVLRSTLEPLIEQGYSVVVVDDGSADETGSILAELPVHVLRHPINLGQGAALQTGMTYALAQGASILVHFDADGQHPAAVIEELIEPLRRGEADLVLGSRFLRPESVAAIPRLRRMVLRGGIVVNGLFTGLWATDAHNGLRAMTARAAASIELSENGFAHATEILGQIRRAKLRWVERPVTVAYPATRRRRGQRNLNAIDILLDLLSRRYFR